jgi:hypothetical protein
MAYVYGHYKADTGELFYIGKGTGKRAWDERYRNKHWQSVVKKHGYVVKILAENLTDDEAYRQESAIIAEVGRQNLTNKTEGGEGLTSAVSKEIMNAPEVKKKISDASKQQWQDPEFRKRHQESMRKARESKEYKENHRAAMVKLSQDTEWLERNAQRSKVSARNPERIEKIRESSRQRWQDPVYKERTRESMKKGWRNQYSSNENLI